MYRQMDIQIDGQIDRWIDRQMDRQIDGQMDRWTKGQIERYINNFIFDNSNYILANHKYLDQLPNIFL